MQHKLKSMSYEEATEVLTDYCIEINERMLANLTLQIFPRSMSLVHIRNNNSKFIRPPSRELFHV